MILNLDRFIGKVAVVTGASAGIGVAIVEELVKHGILVAGLARRVERICEQAEQLKDEPGQLHAYKCDMTVEDEIVSTFKDIIQELGDIHILVNNAGLMLNTELIGGDSSKWRTVMDTNVLGLCIATSEAVQDMKLKGTRGHIIHINSVTGHQIVDLPGINVYGASKFAVTGLATTLINDLAREKIPIKVTSVSPGYVKTEFTAIAGLGDELPIPGVYAPDIAAAVIYALSTAPHVNCIWLALAVGSVISQSRSVSSPPRTNYNPLIIQDSRLEPNVDGTFGFQYRTEDGISHTAQGDPNGFIQGTYSYKDPTGLKVNFNYFAGTRNTQNSSPQPQPQSRPAVYNNPHPQYTPPQQQQYYSEPAPYQPAQEYIPRTRPPSSYTKPQYEQPYECRYSPSTSSRRNEVNC